MDELRVPKRRVTIEVGLTGGTTRRLDLFLAEFASQHIGEERVSDVLNGHTEFIPAFDGERKAMTFTHRDALMWANLSVEDEPPTADAHTIPSEHEVELALSDGSVHRGLISYVRPPDRARIIDYLNEAPRFFRLVQGERVMLVNKRHVAQVISLNG